MIIEDLKYKNYCYYGEYSLKNVWRILRIDGTSAMILFRICHFLVKHHLAFVSHFFRGFNRIANGCWIGRNADFGKGFVIMHSSGIVINSGVKGGENIIIQSGVVIGVAMEGGGGNTKVPTLGSNIYIGAGAKILGGISVGDNVTVGANAVVLRDVPNDATVVGVPAKVIKINGLRVS